MSEQPIETVEPGDDPVDTGPVVGDTAEGTTEDESLVVSEWGSETEETS